MRANKPSQATTCLDELCVLSLVRAGVYTRKVGVVRWLFGLQGGTHAFQHRQLSARSPGWKDFAPWWLEARGTATPELVYVHAAFPGADGWWRARHDGWKCGM